MPTITVSSHVDAPIERVFEAYTDYEHAASRVRGIKSVEMLTPGPVGVGTRFRETRVMMGREASEVMTVAELEPPRRCVLKAESHGTKYVTTFLFAPEGVGTTVTCEFSGEPQKLGARVIGAVMLPMMKKMLRRCLEEDMEDIRLALESTPPA